MCPHCWGVNVGAERLCGRCGADMTLLLQESGGLRRTPAVQSPVPVRVAGRLGPLARAALLLFTALLAIAWLVAPLLGNSGVFVRNHRQSGRGGEGEKGRTPGGWLLPLSRSPALPLSAEQRSTAAPGSSHGRGWTW